MRRRRRCALAGTTSSSTIHNASFGTGTMVRAGTCRRSVPDPRKGGKEETGPPRPGCGTVPEAESGRIRSVNTGTSHAGGVILNRAGEEEGASIGTGLVAIRVSVTESTAQRFDAHPWRGHREEREQERRPPRSVCRSIPGRGFDSHPSVCPKEQAIACFSIPSTPPLRIDPTQERGLGRERLKTPSASWERGLPARGKLTKVALRAPFAGWKPALPG